MVQINSIIFVVNNGFYRTQATLDTIFGHLYSNELKNRMSSAITGTSLFLVISKILRLEETRKSWTFFYLQSN